MGCAGSPQAVKVRDRRRNQHVSCTETSADGQVVEPSLDERILLIHCVCSANKICWDASQFHSQEWALLLPVPFLTHVLSRL